MMPGFLTRSRSLPPKVTKTILVFLALLVMLVVVAFGAALWGGIPPKDAILRMRFQTARHDFEQLRRMFVEDELETVAESGKKFARKEFQWTTAGEARIPPARQQTYAQLMKRLQVKRMDRWEDGSTSMLMASWGPANKGWRANLVSTTVEPVSTLTTLDDRKTSPDEEEAWSHVEGNWYLRIVW